MHVTVFGTKWCGWTSKQTNDLRKSKKFTVSFVDCDKHPDALGCKEASQRGGYPTLEVGGRYHAGYHPPSRVSRLPSSSDKKKKKPSRKSKRKKNSRR